MTYSFNLAQSTYMKVSFILLKIPQRNSHFTDTANIFARLRVPPLILACHPRRCLLKLVGDPQIMSERLPGVNPLRLVG